MTVAVALSFEDVVERLENPKEAVESLGWADYVGVASEKPQHAVNGFCARREIHIDFFPGPDSGKFGTLDRVKGEMDLDAERYVYVGRGKRDEVAAEKAGWEFMDADEVADNMGWEFVDGDTD